MRPLPAAPVFTRADARAFGWSDEALTRAVRSGRLFRVRHGQLSADPDIGHHLLAIAAVHACAGSVLSHRTALLDHGLPIVGPRSAVPELTVPPRRIGRLVDAHLHRATLLPEDVVEIGGVPVTSVARTLVDVARARPTSTAVAAIDAGLYRGLVTEDELYEVARRCWNWPGIRRALRALRLADARSESPLESVSRLVIRWLGLPTPDLQPLILDEYGHPVARLDFYWDAFGVAGEADGRSKYDERDVLTAEKERQEITEDLGVAFVRWGWDQVVRRPRQLKARLESGFERGRLRDQSGFRRRWSVQLTSPDHLARKPDRHPQLTKSTAGRRNACPKASAGSPQLAARPS